MSQSQPPVHVTRRGSGQPLLLLHGFTGSAATWDNFVGRLPEDIHAIAVDLIGHGHSESPAELDRYQMSRCARDVLDTLDHLGVERTDVLGYSMGGRVALQLAAAASERVRRLVVESGSPGIADEQQRARRRQADEDLADRTEREGLEAFVAYWETLPLFAGLKQLPETEQQRIHAGRMNNQSRGLANSLRGMGTGAQSSLWDSLPTLRMPTLYVAGALDTAYVSVGERVSAAMPNARLAVIPNAGHTVHLEQPNAFAAAVLPFLVGS